MKDRPFLRRAELVVVLALTVASFAVRADRLGLYSFSEDEAAKWQAVQQYREHHFAGVNSEHPMLMKVLAWASLGMGERWNRLASAHGWPSPSPEAWLRLPNAVLGAAITAILYLLCRQMMGVPGSFAAAFFWAFSPLPIALNRLLKEETALTFFTLLACFAYWRAKRAETEPRTRGWLDLSAIGFGLAFASQYVPYLFGLNMLAWHEAGRIGLDRKPFWRRKTRFLLLMFLAFVLANPVVLSPANFTPILHWLHADGVHHNGYDFDGRLYFNLPFHTPLGMPWYYFFWLLLVKTPLPILASALAGSWLLLRERSLTSCLLLSLGVLQLLGLSVSGAKWIRYSLPLLPFFFLAGGYGIEKLYRFLRQRQVSLAVVGLAALLLFGWPLLQLRAWAPYYSLYLNALGGGTRDIARYFAPDELSELDTREAARIISSTAPLHARLATSRPMSMTYYLERDGRSDIRVVPLYDPSYNLRNGDLIDLEDSRRFFETQPFFHVLEHSDMPRKEIRVGPILASTIYHFQIAAPKPMLAQGDPAAARPHGHSPASGLQANNGQRLGSSTSP
jgi:Dolichyl-phosphate-mannose-protein mannosyltransferase